MNTKEFKTEIKNIVKNAAALKNKHTSYKNAPVNYACIFSRNMTEYDDLVSTAHKIGKVIKNTRTGLIFQIHPLKTASGNLRLLKIRLPDATRPELGYADFTISNFSGFKKKYLSKNEFKLIKRRNFEMVELIEHKFNVRAYFSSPPLNEQLGIR